MIIQYILQEYIKILNIYAFSNTLFRQSKKEQLLHSQIKLEIHK